MEPSRSTALMLLGAVLSDTVILNSPTTTQRDRIVCDRLGDLLELDPIAFGRELFKSSSDVSNVSADELVTRDAKSYELGGGTTICIAQIETVGDGLLERVDELREAIDRRREKDGHRVMALMITDILAKGTQLVVAGDVGLAERALGADADGGVIPLPGVMSRKKQVAPRLLAAA
jgi:manganese-dependent inorganic pyrophosphatase